MKKLKPFIRRIRTDIKNFIFYYTRTTKSCSSRDEKLQAIVNFDHYFMINDLGRYIYIICKYMEYAGFNVTVKTTYSYIKGRVRYKELLLKQKYNFVRECSTPLNSVTLKIPGINDKLLKINYDDAFNKADQDCIAPYPMHPKQYISSTSTHLLQFRNPERSIKVFFAGNTKEKSYRNNILEKKYNVISRYNVLKDLERSFGPSRRIVVISDKAALYKIVDSKDLNNIIVISEARSDPGDWLRILSKAVFFIAPPGVLMPWCHNAIEAMAVGTIPILQYASFFNPPLVHMENCLCFSDYKSLEETIEMALNLEDDEIRRLQKNVIRYFEQYLSIESITSSVKTFVASDKQLMNVGIPFIV